MIKINVYINKTMITLLVILSISVAGCQSNHSKAGKAVNGTALAEYNSTNDPGNTNIAEKNNKVTVRLEGNARAQLIDTHKAQRLKQQALACSSDQRLSATNRVVKQQYITGKQVVVNHQCITNQQSKTNKPNKQRKINQNWASNQHDVIVTDKQKVNNVTGALANNGIPMPANRKMPAKVSSKIPVPANNIVPNTSEPSPEDTPVAAPVCSAEDIISKLPAFNDPGLKNKMISVNFNHADIRSVIKTISEITGINFIVDESITGTVTVLSPTKLPLGELFHFLESILQVKGYAAIPAGDHIKIVPRTKADNFNIRIRIGADPAKIPQDDSIVTQLMPLHYANAEEISNIIKPTLSAGAQLSVYSRTNTIIITDTSANIYHVACMLKQLDIPGAKKQMSVIPLKYASAQLLSKQITDIMTKGANSPGRTSIMPVSKSDGPDVKVQAEPRTNSLIVVANQHNTQVIEKLVNRLDIERPMGAYNVHVVYLKNAEAKSTAASLSKALANRPVNGNANSQLPIRVTPDEGTNSLIIQASAQDFKLIDQIIQKLDVERQNVLVELLIMEISEDKLKEIGVDWASMDQAVANSVRAFGNTNFGVRLDAVNNQPGGLRIGAFKQVGGKVKIGTILSALEKVSGVNILSTPHLLTCNHSPAEIVVGDNIPYVTQSRITETDPSTPTVIKTIDYKDVGVSMKITPHISQGGMVRLSIDSEFTQLIEGVTGLSADTPTTAKRQIKTEISMDSGSTVVIGGLIRDSKNKITKKVPLLGDIPLLGGLFKYTKERREKTNLLLFITPYVLQNQSDLQNITAQKRKEVTSQLPLQFRNK